ncbi:unnamed protein product (macronuclear) [Paramecium tetraurelia]|uniref:Uncharacterized protein n=1 Tax=Paramecium tetraurelia TaxID=5888 RepID=A0BXC9_PARTE|nr:uncharacterized protein GSPATT00033049001 [Paramecium tetraurelia]CAK63196.1 unnamed protein product [Paramecium tetraurelia]|eukprot:XP_001430594.1 hypothetical protein (macronuclear) [Paramecium tetraurelia strain d4-2]
MNYTYSQRPSSYYKIITNTVAIAYFGYFYGMAEAIYKNKSKFIQSNKYCFYGLLAGYTHQQLNEIGTGILIRNYGFDQYWLSNTAAGLINCGIIYSAMQLRNSENGQFIKAQKYAGTICLISMFLDLFSQMQRDLYLEYPQQGKERKKY